MHKINFRAEWNSLLAVYSANQAIGRIGETPIATVIVWMKEEYFVVFLI